MKKELKNRKHSRSAHGQKPNASHVKSKSRGRDNQAKTSDNRLPSADIYGFHAISAAWLNGAREISSLYITQNALNGFEDVIAQGERLGLKRPAPTLVDKAQLEKALPRDAVYQGLAIACAPLDEIGLDDLIRRDADAAQSLLVILDQVTDPHNVGAILRSACAFGAQGLVMQKKNAPELSGPAGGILAKTACGALEHVAVAYETNLSRGIEALQGAGYFVYGLDERGEDIGAQSFPPKVALVMGAEGPGIRRLVKEHCDALLRLPMDGAMPSINVSNAAAVALYAVSNHKFEKK